MRIELFYCEFALRSVCRLVSWFCFKTDLEIAAATVIAIVSTVVTATEIVTCT